MPITEEQYNKFNVGDTVTVVESNNGKHVLHTDVVLNGGRSSWNNPNDSKVFGFSESGWNIIPGLGGIYFTLIEHKPKPVPSWHTAKVIKVDGKYYVNYFDENHPNSHKSFHNRKGIGWIGSGGGLSFADNFDGKYVEVVRQD